MTDQPHVYDIAVSFSGAQRDYVEDVVESCKQHRLRVFYDKDATIELWGRNVITELRKIYSSADTRYVVAFFSREYLDAPYPMDELHASLVRGLHQQDYILPVMMDDVEVPAEYLNPAIIYLRGDDYSPDKLADMIVKRVGHAAGNTTAPAPPAAVPSESPTRRPRLAPNRFSPHTLLDQALQHVGRRFQQDAPTLEEYGFHCHVRSTSERVAVLVEHRGQPVCELRVSHGDSLWSGQLTVSFAWPRLTTNGVNGFVKAQWDPESETPKLRYTDHTLAGTVEQDQLLTDEEFFHRLWEKIVQHLERTAR